MRRELLCLVYAFVMRPPGQAGYYVLDLSVPSSVRPSVRPSVTKLVKTIFESEWVN